MKFSKHYYLKEEAKIYDDAWNTPEKLLNGLKQGKLLVHARVKDGTDFKWGIEPSAGDWLTSTDMWQTSVEYYGEGPELTFFSDNLSWSKGVADNRKVSPDKIELVWVEKQPEILQYVGDDKVRTHTGQVIRYEMSDMADYEDPLYKDIPAGVETNDWFTNQTVDVVAVTDIIT